MTDNQIAMVAIIIIGGGTLAGVFWRMREGFGPYNLKVVGLVLVAVLASLLGAGGQSYAAAIGILGTIAGYLFGRRED